MDDNGKFRSNCVLAFFEISIIKFGLWDHRWYQVPSQIESIFFLEGGSAFRKHSSFCPNNVCLSSESEMAKRVLRLSAHVICLQGWCGCFFVFAGKLIGIHLFTGQVYLAWGMLSKYDTRFSVIFFFSSTLRRRSLYHPEYLSSCWLTGNGMANQLGVCIVPAIKVLDIKTIFSIKQQKLFLFNRFPDKERSAKGTEKNPP